MDSEIEFLLSPEAVNASADKMLKHLLAGHTHFFFHEEKMLGLAQLVAEVTRKNYPDLNVPYHSRWKHFEAGGSPERLKKLAEALAGKSAEEKLRAQVDLTIVSVLLDAGAGPQWTYRDEYSGKSIGRSEGLGLASFDAFLQGKFSQDFNDPLRVDAEKLVLLREETLKEIFQITDHNPMSGLVGRMNLLRSLGEELLVNSSPARPSVLVDKWMRLAVDKKLLATDILKVLLKDFAGIWPSRIQYQGQSLGDVWHYPPFGQEINKDSLVAFHKLSQWLSFSLFKPLEEFGFEIINIDQLSGLAEYRNGGLFIDFEVLTLKNPELLDQEHEVNSELIIEWRSLTLALLKKLAPLVRKELNKNDLSLPKILEGGTWWAGRKLAAEKRVDSSPPIKIKSDGTVF